MDNVRREENHGAKQGAATARDDAFAHTVAGGPAPLGAPAQTVGYGAAPPVPKAPAPAHRADTLSLDATMAGDTAAPVSAVAIARTRGPAPSSVRTTVLPRVRVAEGGVALEVGGGAVRYDEVKVLGAGGMGQVLLAQDRDIDRPVALKRLHPELVDDATLIRFAEEIRTIGGLEHPNIVPVHDVGVDANGAHYFVMKYVEGETLESIVDKLAAGDPAYLQKYTFEARTRIFAGVLQAIAYAHERGIVHRDIKPANVMVGPHGEVMVMDWGLAKKIRGGKPAADLPQVEDGAGASAAREGGGTERERMFKTRHGSLLGTPAYMSPEQARGHNDALDERSDVYSLCVMFHELLLQRHYLAEHQTVVAVLAAIASDAAHDGIDVVRAGERTGAPAELLHYVRRGLAKDPAGRYASAAEMLVALKAIEDGQCQVDCPVTLIKRSGSEFLHFVDRHPRLAMTTVYGGLCAVLAGGVGAVVGLVHLLS